MVQAREDFAAHATKKQLAHTSWGSTASIVNALARTGSAVEECAKRGRAASANLPRFVKAIPPIDLDAAFASRRIFSRSMARVLANVVVRHGCATYLP